MEEQRPENSATRSAQTLPLEAVSLQSATSELEALEKVRTILFGPQLEEQQNRLNQVGTHLSLEISNMRQQVSHRIQKLEDEVRSEVTEIRTTFERHQRAQTETESVVQQTLLSLRSHLDAFIAEMNTEVTALKMNVDDLQQSHTMETQQIQQHLDRVDQLVENLKATKVDYSRLAGLFGEAAGRLQEADNR